MNITLRVDATPSAPALLLRPWGEADIGPLVEAFRDPALRRGANGPMESAEDLRAWLELQGRGWVTGERLAFAVLEDHPGSREGRLAGSVVIKRGISGQGPAEAGYWTAAHARGRGVAPALWRPSPAGPSRPSRPTAWRASTCSIRWTIRPRAGSRRRPATSSARSFRPSRRPSPGPAICMCGGPAPGLIQAARRLGCDGCGVPGALRFRRHEADARGPGSGLPPLTLVRAAPCAASP